MRAGFVHLRLHTEYSLIDSVVRVPELIEAVADAGMAAVAVTDQSNLFAMVKFYRAALARGVKPLIGVDLLVREGAEHTPASRLTLICQSQSGYRNVTRLVSRAYLEGQQRGVPMIEREWLTPAALEGLIGLSCAAEGDVGRALANGREHDAEVALERWLGLLPERYYLELQRLGRPGEEAYIAAAVTLAGRRGVPVIATNDVRFLRREDFESHEARVCIHDGAQLADPARARRYSPAQYLRTGEEMAALFADIPEALANTVEVARRASLVLELGKPQLPPYPVPGRLSTDEFLRAEAAGGLERRFAELAQRGAPPEPATYRARLERELDVICQMGFAGYFLIVADFIRWARGNDVPVGPGRGSGAGSLVAYCLGITDLDPLRYELLFERFLNPERVSMPDFDVDFCMAGRDRVIEYVAGRYGRERVSQIITYGTMAAKAVVRDVGRVLGMSYGYVDKIAKLIPFELGITLDEALEKEPELKKLYDTEEEVRALIDLARALEGLTRNAGMHAGGVVIAPSVLTDFTPLYCDDAGGSLVTQFDKDDVEAAGLVKFDFLGLRTLTIIDWTVKSINAKRAARGAAALEIERIPLDDAATYERVFKTAQTVAVFQFESGGMRRMLKDAKPDRIEDLIALGALYRPGPMDLIPEYIACKHGKKPQYLHPQMEQVLGVTYGVFVYQEQVMQIAQRLAGYTLGGADLLRRAMGKKKPEEMAKQRGVFLQGAAARGIAEPIANAIFDQMEKFAGYGFNKSHAAAYALVSYQTAWMKANHPEAFLAACMSLALGNTDRLAALKQEAERSGIPILPPDINRSGADFGVERREDGRLAIRYALAAVKKVGFAAMAAVTAARGDRPFAGLADFAARVDPRQLNKMQLEGLARAGAFDTIEPNRARVFAGAEAILRRAQAMAAEAESGQIGLFGGGGARQPEPLRLPDVEDWPPLERLGFEADAVGFHLTAHPLDAYRTVLGRLGVVPIAQLEARAQAGATRVKLAGTVVGAKERITRTGSRMAWVRITDASGSCEVTVFSEVLARSREVLAAGSNVLVAAELQTQGEALRVTAQDVTALDRAAAAVGTGMRVWVAEPAAVGTLRDLLAPQGGGKGRVILLARAGDSRRVELALPGGFTVTPALVQSLTRMAGVERVEQV